MSGTKTTKQQFKGWKRKRLPLKLRVKTKPIAASRPRVPRFGKPYFPKTYKRWRDEADKLIAASDLLIDFPVRVEVVFAIPRSRTSKLIVPMGDGDNFEKAIFDLLQRKGYLMDDKYITSGSWVKRFLPFGKAGYTEVTIMEEPDDVDIAK